MFNKVKTFIENNNLLNKSILLAVSGGRDSMSLLHCLYTLRNEFNLTLSVAYINHHLRQDSDEEETFVTNAVSSLEGITLYKHVIDKNIWADLTGSPEEKARKIRYEFFYKIANENNIDFIATAHHFDDRIETFFINLLRGGGVETLCSIRQINGKIIRPLLNISRDEINSYIDQNKILFIDDYTNSQDDYLRNKIRHNIMPELARITPHYKQSFAHVFDYLTENVQAIDYYTELAMNCVVISSDSTSFTLNRVEFDKLPIAIRKNVIKLIIEKLHYPTEINLPLLTTLTAAKPKRINFSKGSLRAISKGKELRIARE